MTDFSFNDIVRLNHDFYESTAASFSLTRKAHWKGWDKLVPYINSIKQPKLLDLGCGNGRFYGFLAKALGSNFEYVGIDFSEKLIVEARTAFKKGDFGVGDFTVANPAFNNAFDVVVGFGIMHHVYTTKKQQEFITTALDYVKKGGFLIVAFWTKNPTENKIVKNLGGGDFVLNWDNDNNKQRFVHVFNETEVGELFRYVGTKVKIINTFFEDNTNLYVICQKV